jgi:chemotaxis protein methyltransferase CheR
MSLPPSAGGLSPRAFSAFLTRVADRLQLQPASFERLHGRIRKKVVRRLHGLGLQDFEGYLGWLADHPEEWDVLDELCRVVVSRCCRDAECWRELQDEVVPALAGAALQSGRQELDVWSVGCASGEEAWTCRLMWDLGVAVDFPSLQMTVLATDVDPVLIARAERACYPASSLRELPQLWRAAFAVDGEEHCLRDEFRHGIEFAVQDVRAEMPEGPFDLVLCRNVVFTYFDIRLQRRLSAAMHARLRPNGRIIVGRGESDPLAQ